MYLTEKDNKLNIKNMQNEKNMHDLFYQFDQLEFLSIENILIF